MSALRLDENVIPLFEAIDLRLDPEAGVYSGKVRIELEVRKKTGSFYFHSEGLKLGSVTLQNQVRPVPLRFQAGETGLATVYLRTPLPPGRYSLGIAYSNRLDTRAIGLYRVAIGAEAYVFSQFEAWDARRAFPCWDEPSFKIPYQFTLTVPKDHLAITNTPVQKETVAGDFKTLLFKRTPPIPSYLLAIAAGPFESTPIPGMSIPGRVIAVRGNGRLTAEAARVTPPILGALERYFKSRYPYEKLDLIGVPEFMFGAMENPGAVTFRDTILLFEARKGSVAQRCGLASTVAHELAHMWFGNLVTMRWWDDLWLNESFASWLGDKIAHGVFPEFGIADTDVKGAQQAMRRDAMRATRSIRQPVTPRDNPLQSFDVLAYEKGQAVLGMFEQWLGPGPFQAGVLDYLRAHRWKNAVAGDLWKSLSKRSGEDVGTLMSPFLDHPGVPLVQAEILPDGRVAIRQRRALHFGQKAPAPRRWKIPVVLRYPDGKRLRTKSVLLEKTREIVRLRANVTPAWIHPNAGEQGYYRWQISTDMLIALAREAGTALRVRERIGFVDNLSFLLDAGALSGDRYLEALSYFSGDPSPQVMLALVGALDKIREELLSEGMEEAFSRYVRATLGPALDRFGRARRKEEDEDVSFLRPELIEWIAHKGKDRDMVRYAEDLARGYLRRPSSVDPALIRVSLQVAALEGDEALFEFYRKGFESAKAPAERGYFLHALGAFRNRRIIEKALRYVLRGPLRPQEYLLIPQGIAKSDRYKDRVLEWLMSDYDTLTARMAPSYAMRLPWFANGSSEKRLKTAKTFFEKPSRKTPGLAIELRRVSENVMRCVRLQRREGRRVASYLGRFPKTR